MENNKERISKYSVLQSLHASCQLTISSLLMLCFHWLNVHVTISMPRECKEAYGITEFYLLNFIVDFIYYLNLPQLCPYVFINLILREYFISVWTS